MDIPRAKAARAELVDHARAVREGRKKFAKTLFSSWPRPGTEVEYLVDGNSPQASIRAVFLCWGWTGEGEQVGTIETRPMEEVSRSLNSVLPRRIEGVRLSALRKVET